MLRTHSPLILSTSAGTPICSCVCTHGQWFEWLRHLYFMYCAWAGFSGGKEQEDKLHACYCLCAIQHVTWYVCTLLVCNLWVFWEISLASLLHKTHMHLSSLNWAGVLWWMPLQYHLHTTAVFAGSWYGKIFNVQQTSSWLCCIPKLIKPTFCSHLFKHLNAQLW